MSTLKSTVRSENCKEWMESLLISSGKISQDPAHCSFSTQIQKDLGRTRITPDEFSDRIIFMSMFNDIELQKRGHEDSCALTSRAIRDYPSRFEDGHWAFLGPGEENKWYFDFGSMPEGKWDLCASRMVNDFENSGHQKKGWDTIHFNGEYSNIDLWYRTVHSANQLCIHGEREVILDPKALGERREKFI